MWMDLLNVSPNVMREAALIDAQGSHSWTDLASASRHQAEALQAWSGRRVGLPFGASARDLSVLAALDQIRCDVFLMDRQAEIDAWRQWCGDLQLAALIPASVSGDRADPCLVESFAAEVAGSGQSTVTILTSGTTGKPKAVRHTWESLLGPVRRTAAGMGSRWLLTYRPHLYAGLQVLLQCLANRGALVVPPGEAGPNEITEFMVRHQVACVSATPSYWRRLLLFANRQQLARAPLRQITLGGELIDQQILEVLHQTFPHARIVHIYATTELGRCFSVTDGRAGFPARYLEEPLEGGIQLQMREGLLWVRPAHGMQTYDPASGNVASAMRDEGGWFCTGDRVEVRGDRVYFLGRDSDLINVGGNKVSPIEVERVLREIPGIADVCVFGARSSIAGQLVGCDVVLHDPACEAAVRSVIHEVCREKLTTYQRPRVIRFVEAISMTNAGKTDRRE